MINIKDLEGMKTTARVFGKSNVNGAKSLDVDFEFINGQWQKEYVLTRNHQIILQSAMLEYVIEEYNKIII